MVSMASPVRCVHPHQLHAPPTIPTVWHMATSDVLLPPFNIKSGSLKSRLLREVLEVDLD